MVFSSKGRSVKHKTGEAPALRSSAGLLGNTGVADDVVAGGRGVLESNNAGLEQKHDRILPAPNLTNYPTLR